MLLPAKELKYIEPEAGTSLPQIQSSGSDRDSYRKTPPAQNCRSQNSQNTKNQTHHATTLQIPIEASGQNARNSGSSTFNKCSFKCSKLKLVRVFTPPSTEFGNPKLRAQSSEPDRDTHRKNQHLQQPLPLLTAVIRASTLGEEPLNH